MSLIAMRKVTRILRHLIRLLMNCCKLRVVSIVSLIWKRLEQSERDEPTDASTLGEANRNRLKCRRRPP
jgi:hypothetical protein